MQQLAKSSNEAIASLPSALAASDRTAPGDPRSATFFELASLANVDPERAKARWNEIRKAALAEIRTGHLAAKATETSLSSGAWARASFLALRSESADTWKPQNGVERTMIDMMAQAWSAQLFWHERMVFFACVERDNEQVKKDARWATPRVSDVQAVEQAAQMIDRFNRIFMRTLRALKDLRRHSTMVVVQNVEQLNVAGQRLNMT